MKIKTMKNIKNRRDGHHYNSSYWKEYKRRLDNIPEYLYEIYVGCMLGDATMRVKGNKCSIKFEQGYKNVDYLYHLFDISRRYVFSEKPGARYELRGERKGKVKSYYFNTFNLEVFNSLKDLFIIDGKKVVKEGLVKDNLTARGLAYWVMDDGSVDGKTTIIHTSNFKGEEVLLLSTELNEKFGLSSEVLTHKVKYRVIKIPYTDGERMVSIIKPYIHESMRRKIPMGKA